MSKTTLKDLPICCTYPQLNVNLLERVRTFIKNIDTNWNYITPLQLYQKIIKKQDDDLFLLDIRKREDYLKTGHIPGSINIFWQDLYNPENLKKLPCPLHNPYYTIVVICYVGHTSSQTLVLLRLLGFNVVALKFGMGISPVKEVPIRGWLDYHYPVEYGETVTSLSHEKLFKNNYKTWNATGGLALNDMEIRQMYQRQHPNKTFIIDHDGRLSTQDIFRPNEVVVRVENGVVTNERIDNSPIDDSYRCGFSLLPRTIR